MRPTLAATSSTRPDRPPACIQDTVAAAERQIIHAAGGVGIGREAIAGTIDVVRRHARPWIDSGLDRASDDPHTVAQVGELVIRQNAAEALLARASRLIDAAMDEDRVARALIAVPEPLVSWRAMWRQAEGAIARHFGLSLRATSRSTAWGWQSARSCRSPARCCNGRTCWCPTSRPRRPGRLEQIPIRRDHLIG